MHPAAARRILRLALGTGLCLAFSQVVNWPLSFVAPVLTMFILALPLPPPGLRKGIVFVLALLAPTLLGAYALLPFLTHMRGIGILLVGLGLFFTFYYTARGGQPVLGTFMTMGLTLVTTIGSVSSELLILLVQSLGVCAAVGIVFAMLSALTFLPAALVLAGRGIFWPFRPAYGSAPTEVRGVWVDDLDGDGDPDVLGASPGLDEAAWWENDGSPLDNTVDLGGGQTVLSGGTLDNVRYR